MENLREQLHLFNFYRRCIIDSRFKEYGIYFGQPPILEYLLAKPDATQKEIADFLGISPASVAVSVKRMEKTGLVVRGSDKSDARRNNLRITDKGRALLSFAHSTFDCVDRKMTDGLTKEELQTFTGLLSKMNANLSELTPEKIHRNKEDENV